MSILVSVDKGFSLEIHFEFYSLLNRKWAEMNQFVLVCVSISKNCGQNVATLSFHTEFRKIPIVTPPNFTTLVFLNYNRIDNFYECNLF